MIAITVEDLSLSFGVKKILENISFSLQDNDRLGIVGVNGCGKSTLFKLITRELTADGGNVYISKEKTVGILQMKRGKTPHFFLLCLPFFSAGGTPPSKGDIIRCRGRKIKFFRRRQRFRHRFSTKTAF